MNNYFVILNSKFSVINRHYLYIHRKTFSVLTEQCFNDKEIKLMNYALPFSVSMNICFLGKDESAL